MEVPQFGLFDEFRATRAHNLVGGSHRGASWVPTPTSWVPTPPKPVCIPRSAGRECKLGKFCAGVLPQSPLVQFYCTIRLATFGKISQKKRVQIDSFSLRFTGGRVGRSVRRLERPVFGLLNRALLRTLASKKVPILAPNLCGVKHCGSSPIWITQ